MKSKSYTKLFLLALILIPTSIWAQTDTLNYMDANGKKHGHWIQKYENGKIKFEGYFKNDVPIGQLKKYHENGNLKYDMYYNPKDPQEVTVTMYDVAGDLSAQGAYYAKKKNGSWKYYGNGNKLLLEENYNHGMLDGQSIVYWQTQENQPMEIKNWKDSLKHGDWLWFYEDGKIRMKAQYVEDKLQGDFSVFYADGKTSLIGKYYNDVRDGKWQYFKEDGSEKFTIEYNKGKIVNQDEYERAETKMINEEYLEQEGKHVDPQDFLDNPEAYIFGEQAVQTQEQSPKEKKKKEKSKK